MPETKRTQKKGAEFNEYIATGNGNLNKWYYETFISLKASAVLSVRRHSMTAEVKIIQYNIFPFKKILRLSSESVDRFSVIIEHTQPALKSSERTSFEIFKSTFSPQPFNSQDLIANSPIQLLRIFLQFSDKNSVLYPYNNLYLIRFSNLITCLLIVVWILQGEVTWKSLLEVKQLTDRFHGIVGPFSHRTQMTYYYKYYTIIQDVTH